MHGPVETAAYQDSPSPSTLLTLLSGRYAVGTDGATYNGWKWADDATRQMIRDGGWSEYNSAGTLARRYVGIVGLGAVSTGAQLYYQKVSGGAAASSPSRISQ